MEDIFQALLNAQAAENVGVLIHKRKLEIASHQSSFMGISVSKSVGSALSTIIIGFVVIAGIMITLKLIKKKNS